MPVNSLNRFTILLMVTGLFGASAAEFTFGNKVLIVPDGYEIECIAAPPLVSRPISAYFDEQGRLYVTESSGNSSNAQAQLKNPTHQILRLEDSTGSGLFDRRTVFADKLMFPEGCLWLNGSLYVSGVPQIWKFTDKDGDMLREMSVSLGEQIAAQEEEIYKLAGEKFTIGSPKQLGKILFEKLGLESQGTTATGQHATGEEVLQVLAPKHELPRLILEYRQFTKLKNTYVDMLPTMAGPDGRIHASFSQIGSETGRLASHDPNLQNIPIRTELGRSIRAAFKAQTPKGEKDPFKLLTADYSQIELRILAHYSEDPILKEGFARGVDVHTAVAARIFGVKEEDVNREQRARAKTVNFGVLYGQTAFGLSQTLSIPNKEAAAIIRRFFEGHPNVRACLDRIIAEADEKGYVSTILGRRRFVPQLKEKATRKLGERIAVNTVFQGSAADLIKRAMLEIQTELNASSDLRARMILQIHDELLFECPSKSVAALTKMVKNKMEGALKLNVPLVVETGSGDDWLSAKD